MCFIFDKLYCYKYDGLIKGQNKMWDTTNSLLFFIIASIYIHITFCKGAQWPGSRASALESRGLEFNPHMGHHVLEQDTFNSLQLLVNTQEVLAPSRHNETLLNRTLNLNSNIQHFVTLKNHCYEYIKHCIKATKQHKNFYNNHLELDD